MSTTKGRTTMAEVDIIGGFPITDDKCAGCGKPLLIENAWMTDGCPCNSRLGVNSMNETRWRLLMELQQRQARENEALARSAKDLRLLTIRAAREPNAQKRQEMIGHANRIAAAVGCGPNILRESPDAVPGTGTGEADETKGT